MMFSLWAVFGIAACSAVSGCPVQQLRATVGTPLSRFKDAVRRAEEQKRDGVVDLSAAAPLPTTSRSADSIIRPRMGETASFACDLASHAAQRQKNVDYSARWRHQESIIFANSTPPITSQPFFYSLSKVENTFFLFVHNISLSAAGTVQCLQECLENSVAALCVRKEYEIRPKLSVRDVFVEPVQNVSSRYWSFPFDCKAWVRVPGEEPHFIWKYDKVFVSTPENHYLGEMYKLQPFPEGLQTVSTTVSKCYHMQQKEKAFCQQTATFTTSQVVNLLPTTVECWIQPDLSVEEYYVQTAYVEFSDALVSR